MKTEVDFWEIVAESVAEASRTGIGVEWAFWLEAFSKRTTEETVLATQEDYNMALARVLWFETDFDRTICFSSRTLKSSISNCFVPSAGSPYYKPAIFSRPAYFPPSWWIHQPEIHCRCLRANSATTAVKAHFQALWSRLAYSSCKEWLPNVARMFFKRKAISLGLGRMCWVIRIAEEYLAGKGIAVKICRTFSELHYAHEMEWSQGCFPAWSVYKSHAKNYQL